MNEMLIVWQKNLGLTFSFRLPYSVIHENESSAQKAVSYFKQDEM